MHIVEVAISGKNRQGESYIIQGYLAAVTHWLDSFFMLIYQLLNHNFLIKLHFGIYTYIKPKPQAKCFCTYFVLNTEIRTSLSLSEIFGSQLLGSTFSAITTHIENSTYWQ